MSLLAKTNNKFEIANNTSSEMELDITICEETGEIQLNRDHAVLVKIVRALNSPDLEDFEAFFKEKSIDAEGKRNYKSFCG